MAAHYRAGAFGDGIGGMLIAVGVRPRNRKKNKTFFHRAAVGGDPLDERVLFRRKYMSQLLRKFNCGFFACAGNREIGHTDIL